MELQPVAVAVTAETGKGCVIDTCPIPGNRIGAQNMAQRRPYHTGMGNDQHVTAVIIRQHILQCLRDPLPEIFQRFRARWPVMTRVAIKCFIFLPVTTDDFIRAEPLPATKADFAETLINAGFKPAAISQRLGKSAASSHGRTDDVLPGRALANSVPHLLPTFFAQRIVGTIATKTPAAKRFAMAQKINQCIVHGAFSIYTASLY